MGDLTPREIAMATPKIASNRAEPSAIQRGQTPTIRPIPSNVSATVAVQATNGMTDAGRKELTSAVYLMKLAKFPQPPYLPHSPKRSATADRKAAPSAKRA